MQKIILSIVIFFTTVFCYAKKVINISDYEIARGQDVTPIIRDIIKDNKENIKIIFPEGAYHFYPEKAVGKYHTVTNHDNSYKYFAFPLIECTEIEIDGGGSDFIFHGVITPFLVENSSGIKLKNFSIDWEDPFFLQAEVLRRISQWMYGSIQWQSLYFKVIGLGLIQMGYIYLF